MRAEAGKRRASVVVGDQRGADEADSLTFETATKAGGVTSKANTVGSSVSDRQTCQRPAPESASEHLSVQMLREHLSLSPTAADATEDALTWQRCEANCMDTEPVTGAHARSWDAPDIFASAVKGHVTRKRYEEAQRRLCSIPDLVAATPMLQRRLAALVDPSAGDVAASAPFRYGERDLLLQRGLCFARALVTKADVLLACIDSVDEEQLHLEIVAAYTCAHILQAQARQEQHNMQLAQRPGASVVDDDWDQYRDRGLSRARVLVFAPTRQVAYAFLSAVLRYLNPRQIGHAQRFEGAFGPDADDGTVSEEPNTLLVPPTEPVPDPGADTSRARHWRAKPRDHRAAFKGNIDDDFRLGVRVERRSLHFFADFADSDFVVVSPLGLQRVLDDPDKGGMRGGAADPLSSIEIAVILRSHMMLMQNWDHLLRVVREAVNRMPAQVPQKTDFSRVEQRFLEDHAAAYRQDILLSAFDFPECHAWFRLARRDHQGNVSGVLKLLRTRHAGVIADIPAPRRVRHVFRRLATPHGTGSGREGAATNALSAVEAAELRFAAFSHDWLPKLVQSTHTHILIYIPSYFDFVRVRNLFRKWTEQAVYPASKLSFAACSEYSKPQDISRYRLLFFEGRVRFLLVTERFHFYRRYHLRGSQYIFFYGVPQFPQFYTELVASLEASGSSFRQACTLFIMPDDALALHRIVGSQRMAYITANQLRREFEFPAPVSFGARVCD